MKLGIKHLIECHCTLAIYKGSEDIIYHKFPVYSKIDHTTNKVLPKLAKCNNCEAMHHVYEICKSEIKPGKDESTIVVSKDDISVTLPLKISNILNQYDVDISSWEHVQDIIENKAWGTEIILKRDIVDDKQQVKILTLKSNNQIKISTHVIDNIFTT